MFERAALGSRTEDGDRRVVGELRGERRAGTGVGFPDADVDQHVRIEVDDGLDDAVVFVGVNPVERRTLEPAPRRIGIDPRQGLDPRLVFQQTGDLCAEFAANAAHEHPLTCHDTPR